MEVLLIAYDSEMHINYFPMGLAYVASKLRKQGDEVTVYHQDVYHYPETHLTEYLNDCHFDVVGVGMCAGYYQYAKLKKICNAIHEAKYPPKIWLGGHLVSPEPEYFKKMTGADYICTEEFDYEEDIDNISFPAWDLFPIDYYSLIRQPHALNTDRCFPMLSARGCPFRCAFCYRMGEGYRHRSIDGILGESRILMGTYRISYIDFADELLMANLDRAVELSEAMKPLHLKWCCSGRLNYAKPEVLRVMKDAGCVFINYGIEALDDEVLLRMNKCLTVKQIEDGVKATLEAGISPGLNIMWGNIGDTVETLNKAVEFLLKYDDHAQLRTIRPMTPYPGCALYYQAIKEGRLGGVEDFYENKHKNSDLPSVQFTGLDDWDFRLALARANRRLIDKYTSYMNASYTAQADRLYITGDASFRGFRQT